MYVPSKQVPCKKREHLPACSSFHQMWSCVLFECGPCRGDSLMNTEFSGHIGIVLMNYSRKFEKFISEYMDQILPIKC